MSYRDRRVDAYIARSADFAKPILEAIREVVHAAVPDVEETMKWSFPHFDYKGIMCSMAAFKEHGVFGFWKAPLVLRDMGNRDAMGHFGRLRTVKDLPPKKEFIALVKKAAQLNEKGVKISRPKRAPRGDVQTPDDLAAALKKDKKARSAFEKFPASHRREYIEWITEAKTEATRQRRLGQAVMDVGRQTAKLEVHAEIVSSGISAPPADGGGFFLMASAESDR